MGTIITESSSFLACTGNHQFVESLYPNGLGQVLIGQFGLDQGRFNINLHVYTKPAKTVPKWGVWGENYNVLVLEFTGDGFVDIKIDNWNGFRKAEVVCSKIKRGFHLYQVGSDWKFELVFGMLSFQRGSTYTDDGDGWYAL